MLIENKLFKSLLPTASKTIKIIMHSNYTFKNIDQWQKIYKPSSRQLPISVSKQKNSMGCGTNLLSMVLNALGKEASHGQIDKRIRKLNGFLSPSHIVGYAQNQGIKAKMYNNSSFDEVKSQLDKGNYVGALFRRKILGHYEVITGYRVDNTGKQFISITDEAKQIVKELPFDEFDKEWSQLNIAGIPTPYKRFIILFSKDGNFPNRGQKLPEINETVTNVNEFINFLGILIENFAK